MLLVQALHEARDGASRPRKETIYILTGEVPNEILVKKIGPYLSAENMSVNGIRTVFANLVMAECTAMSACVSACLSHASIPRVTCQSPSLFTHYMTCVVPRTVYYSDSLRVLRGAGT